MSERHIRLRVAVCVRDQDRVLLVQHAKEGRRYWLLPGGGVEVGEAIADAARRELREETGFEVEIGPLALVCESIEPAGRHVVNLVFGGEIRGGTLRVGRNDRRLVDAAWVPLADLRSLRMYPAIADELVAWCSDPASVATRVLGNVWTEDDGWAPDDGSGL